MEQVYSAGAVSRPFWFVEFKKVANLLNRGLSLDEVREKVLSENLFDVAKEYRAKEILNGVFRRIKMLDSKGVALFCESDMATMKLIEFIAIMQTDRLLAEFMNEVYHEKIVVGDYDLRDADFNIYFKRKQDIDEGLMSLKDYTLKKLRNSYVNYMVEAGLVSRISDVRTITPPLMTEELRNYLKSTEMSSCVDVLTGVR